MDQTGLLAKLGGNNTFSLDERITLSDFGKFLQYIDETWLGEEGTSKSSSLFSKDYFPNIFSQNIGIDELEFTPSSKDQPISLALVISWENAAVSLIKDVLELENCAIGISMTGKQLEAILSGVFKIGDYDIQLQIELPSLLGKAQLQINHDLVTDTRDALSILQKYSIALKKPSSQDTNPRLSHLLLLTAPLDKQFIFNLAIQNIQFGKVNLNLDVEFEYQQGAIKGFFYTDFEIELGIEKSILILLSGAYNGPGTGLQLEGGGALSGVTLNDLFGALKTKFGVVGVQPLSETAEITYIYLSFNTQSKDFTFSCSLDFHKCFDTGQSPEKNDVEMKFDFNIATIVENGKEEHELTFSGQVIFHLDGDDTIQPPKTPLELEFDLIFDKAGNVINLIAAYQDLGGGAINIGDLIQLLNPTAPDITISIELKQAYLVFQKAGNKTNYLIGADIGAGIQLSALPLVGALLPAAQNLTLDLQVYHSKDVIKSDDLAHYQSLLPSEGIHLPEEIDKDKTTGVAVNLLLGGDPIRLTLPIDFGSGGDKGSGAGTQPSNEGELNTPQKTVVASLPDSAEAKTKWFDLHKNLGPLHLERIGMQFQKEPDNYSMLFQMDGALSIAGLTLSLDGLAANVIIPHLKKGEDPLPKIEPVFMLRGLGLDFEKGPLNIGGSFLRSTNPGPPPYDEYDGMVTINFEQFGLSAIGSYARVNNHTSLFIYVLVDYPLGGPPFFFMTGLAGAFGYNRALRIPAVEKIKDFPLVSQAMAASAGTATAPGTGDLTTLLQTLHDDIPPQIGEYFFGVGIKFNSFKLLDSFLMLAVSFGNHMEIDVVGLSRLQCPVAVEGEGEEETPPVFVAELAIKASIIPDDGFVGVKAILTSESYLLSKDCHLTGGFAFYTWVSGDHAGDFVLTIGGYHPKFPVPQHYPTVPRLGFNWKITDELHIEGGAYFALTAHTLMAGASLKAVYQSGDIKAWFDAGADFIISWQPYYYDAELHLDIGVDVTIHVFGTEHISLDLGADLHIWGPDFSGTATIHLLVISFTVAFGSGKEAPIPILWEAFQTAFIPDAKKVCSINVSGGLVKKIEGDRPHYIINPRHFQLGVDTIIPITRVTGHKELTGIPIGMGPMGIQIGSEVESELKITIERIVEGAANEAVEDLSYTTVGKRAPAAIWGGKIKPDVDDSSFIEDALMGISIGVNRKEPGHTSSVSHDALGFSPTDLPNAISFETGVLEGQAVTTKLEDVLMNSDIHKSRLELIADLSGYLPPIDIQLDESVVSSFVKAPEILNYQI